MHFSEEHIKYLWERYISQTASLEEMRTLFQLISHPELEDLHQQISQSLIEQQISTLPDMPDIRAEILRQINSKRKEGTTTQFSVSHKAFKPLRFMRRWGWAAAILIFAGTGFYFWLNQKPE